VDDHKNFAYSTVASPPSPAQAGTSLTVTSGHGARFPTPPFNVTLWPRNVQPLADNAEVARVTNVVGDMLTIVRAQESSVARAVRAGDQIAATITDKMLDDLDYSAAAVAARVAMRA